ncbi:MAG TPA: hypothetical protein VKU85_05200 [bacterium]|nr:hypothetical protein [bacterium]
MIPRDLAVLVLAAATLVGHVVPARADDEPRAVIAPEDRETVAAEIRRLFDLHAGSSAYPLPQLEQDDMKALLEGELVRIRTKWTLETGQDEKGEEEPRERHRVMAYRLYPGPRDVVWLSALDPHFLGNDRLSEARLETDGPSSVWYQLMDPPWPVKNRHWVIDVTRPEAVVEASQGRVWELMWALKEDGERIALEVTAAGRVKDVPLERALKSRYLEENLGAWTMFELGDELTLVAYQVTIVMGGWVPDRLTARFAMGAVEDLMMSVSENTRKVTEHYDAEHEPIWGGDGVPLAPLKPGPAAGEPEEETAPEEDA